jgi:hypothetical protein
MQTGRLGHQGIIWDDFQTEDRLALAAKKKTKRAATPQSESYLFRIKQVMPNYSFGTNIGRYDAGTHSEYHHTEIDTVCLSPKRFQYRQTQFTLMADRRLTRELEDLADRARPATGIGTLTLRGNRSNYLGSIPFDAALPIPGLILAGGYGFIYLAGEPMSRGSARIRYISFHHDYDPDDL